ncbi:MAG: IS30 family transposase [Gammaproteobacteria bacterium]
MYSQITADERYTLGLLRRLGLRPADIARALGRHRSTIGRELARNTRPDGGYRPSFAQARTGARRWRSRCGDRFTPAEFALVTARLALKWSPEQIAAVLRRTGQLAISHETIYRYIWADKRRGGQLYTHLRGAPKRCRKRYGSYERRGRLTGKRPITERPVSIATRVEGGHWEMDTVLGTGDRHCVLSLVERTTGYLVLGKLSARTTAAVTRRTIQLSRRERQPVRTITADNGTEFHDYARIERETGTTCYFATPHHAWERGTNENTNGLLRQYLPKGQSMADVTQHDCARIARALNTRPRKRHTFLTPEDRYATLT